MECKVFGADALLVEIGAVIRHIADEGRNDLNAEEVEFITRITKRMIKETKMQVGAIPHMLPEEIPQETIDQILRCGVKVHIDGV